MSQIIDPDRVVINMAGDRILAKATAARLPAPVRRGDPPAIAVPFFEALKILFVVVAAPRKEQDRTARAVGILPRSAASLLLERTERTCSGNGPFSAW